MKIIVATHGKMAEGIKNTLQLLCGEKDNINYISGYVSDISIEEEVRKIIQNTSEEVIILTDLLGGSVNQIALRFVSERVHVIAGFNLVLLIELSCRNEISKEELINLILMSREQMKYMNDIEIEEDSFF